MNRFYLDTCILVALATKEATYEDIKAALKIVLNIDNSELVTSDFAFVEMAKVLVNQKEFKPKKASKVINDISKNTMVDEFSFTVIPTENNPSYSFDKFWFDVAENMSLYNPGWGDAIHCVIMRNNDISNIISIDTKDDFEIVRGINLLHPESILHPT